jgi:hypothetical protein
MVFTEMIDRSIYHDLPQPSFEGAYHIGIRRTVMMDLPEYLQEPVIQYLHGVFFIAGVTVADGHSIAIERVIDDLLALPFIQGTSPNMVGQFFCRQQVLIMFHSYIGLWQGKVAKNTSKGSIYFRDKYPRIRLGQSAVGCQRTMLNNLFLMEAADCCCRLLSADC